MSQPAEPLVFWGAIIHSTSLTNLTILENGLIAIQSGRILALQPCVPHNEIPSTLTALGLNPSCPVKKLPRGQFLIPGFVDTHNHAPQWMQRGQGQGMQILDWLSEITFPNEARFADPEYARRVYRGLVRGMIRQGVTTASYYGSLHGEATRVLADVCLEMGQRALVGKCNMDRNAPDYYRDQSPEESLAVTQECIDHIHTIDPKGTLIRPVLTPRFAITCAPDLLTGLGEIARSNPNMAIQTHFNEAQQEISTTLSLFPQFTNEADLYEDYGLLTPRSILAHCTIMTSYETRALARLGCGVAHCPTANMTVGGGFMAAPVKGFLEAGVEVGLGTDSGGGFSCSMLDAMRHALIASFAREALYDKSTEQAQPAPASGSGSGSTSTPDSSTLSVEEVFYMATLGGAKVVGFGDEVGDFTAGKQFDALVVDVSAERGGVNAPLEEEDSTRTAFEKFVMTGDDRNLIGVYVGGREVGGRV